MANSDFEKREEQVIEETMEITQMSVIDKLNTKYILVKTRNQLIEDMRSIVKDFGEEYGFVIRNYDTITTNRFYKIGRSINSLNDTILSYCIDLGAETDTLMYFDEDFLVWTRELDKIPFDKDGCRATGREICHLDKDFTDSKNWWNEYETEEGDYTYGR